MDQSDLNMRRHRWLDVVNDYNCEILNHLGKANVVVDALSLNTTIFAIKGLCMRISIDSPLLYLIKEAQTVGVKKENWKQ